MRFRTKVVYLYRHVSENRVRLSTYLRFVGVRHLWVANTECGRIIWCAIFALDSLEVLILHHLSDCIRLVGG